MSYLELPFFSAAATNTVGNTTGNNTVAMATTEDVAETDGQTLVRLPSFSQLLQTGKAKIMEADADSVASTSDPVMVDQAVNDSGVNLPIAGQSPLLNTGLLVSDAIVMGQIDTDPKIAILTFTFGASTIVTGENKAGNRHNTLVKSDTDSDPDKMNADIAGAIWPGLALFMESRAALNGADTAKADSPTMAATGTGAVGYTIHTRIGSDQVLAPVPMTSDLPAPEIKADAVAAMTKGIIATENIVTTENSGSFPLSFTELTVGDVFHSVESLPRSLPVATSLSSHVESMLPNLSDRAPVIVGTPPAESVKPLPPSPANFVVQNVMLPPEPSVDQAEVAPIVVVEMLPAASVKPLPPSPANFAVQDVVLSPEPPADQLESASTVVATPTAIVKPLPSADLTVQSTVLPPEPSVDRREPASMVAIAQAETPAAEIVRSLPPASAVVQGTTLPPPTSSADQTESTSAIAAAASVEVVVKPVPLSPASVVAQSNALPIVSSSADQPAASPIAAVGMPTTEAVGRLTAAEVIAAPVSEATSNAAVEPLELPPIAFKLSDVRTVSVLSMENRDPQTAAAVVAENSSIVNQEYIATSLKLGTFRLVTGRALPLQLTDMPRTVDSMVTTQTDFATQIPTTEIQPALASVNIASINSTHSDPLFSTTQNSFAAAATQLVRPQLTNAVDNESPQPENVPEDSAVIREVDLVSPAHGSGLTPANMAITTSPRTEVVTSPILPPSISGTLDLQQSNWGRTLGQQLNWMVNNQMQEASIRVNPPDLGPIEVRLSLQHNQTNVTFFCHEAVVREAIANAIPQLREMLSNQGIYLNQAQVSDQSLARQQPGFGEQPPDKRNSGSAMVTPDQNPVIELTDHQLRSRHSLGMVDHYV